MKLSSTTISILLLLGLGFFVFAKTIQQTQPIDGSQRGQISASGNTFIGIGGIVITENGDIITIDGSGISGGGGDVFQASNNVFSATNTFTAGTNHFNAGGYNVANNIFLGDNSTNTYLQIRGGALGDGGNRTYAVSPTGYFYIVSQAVPPASNRGIWLYGQPGSAHFFGQAGVVESLTITGSGGTRIGAGSFLNVWHTGSSSLAFTNQLALGQVETNTIAVLGTLPGLYNIAPNFPEPLPMDSVWTMNCATNVIRVYRQALTTPTQPITNTFGAWLFQ